MDSGIMSTSNDVVDLTEREQELSRSSFEAVDFLILRDLGSLAGIYGTGAGSGVMEGVLVEEVLVEEEEGPVRQT